MCREQILNLLQKLFKKKKSHKVETINYSPLCIYVVLELFYFIQKYCLQERRLPLKTHISLNSIGRHGLLLVANIYSLIERCVVTV